MPGTPACYADSGENARVDDGQRYRERLRRRVNRRRFLNGSGVAAAGAAALLAGCGGKPPAPSPSATKPQTAAPTTPAVATDATVSTPPATPAAAPRRGGTLRLWKRQQAEGLDPGVFTRHNGDVLLPTLTQPYTYQPTRNLFAMDGMTGFEQVDPVTLVWSVRPGMTFHNSEPVDAEAVAFSFGRLVKLWRTLDWTDTAPDGFAFVERFEAVDALTLAEHWERPHADAPVYRARSAYSFLNPRLVEAQGAFAGSYEHPDGRVEDIYRLPELPHGAGSGPYTLVRHDAASTRVERWPDYHPHLPPADGFVEDGPYIEAWETRLLEREAARDAFLAGELDVFGRIAPEELPAFEGLDHIDVAEIPNGGHTSVALDGGTLHDKRARLALRQALDYAAFSDELELGASTYTAPIANLLPHFQRLSQQELRQWYRYDPKEARALWEAAAFSTPVATLRLLEQVPASTLQQKTNRFLAGALHEALGVAVETFTRDPRYQHGSDIEHWEMAAFRGADGVMGIPGDSYLSHYDPRTTGFLLRHHAGSPHREIATDAAALTSMLEAQEYETDFDARTEALTAIQRWILERAWCVLALPVSTVSYYGFSSRLRDHAPEDWPNGYGLRRESMWLAEA